MFLREKEGKKGDCENTELGKGGFWNVWKVLVDDTLGWEGVVRFLWIENCLQGLGIHSAGGGDVDKGVWGGGKVALLLYPRSGKVGWTEGVMVKCVEFVYRKGKVIAWSL